MSEELKPCPFCGGEAELGWHQHIGGDPIYHARCAKACHAMNGWSENRDKAIAAWNRRAEAPPRMPTELEWSLRKELEGAAAERLALEMEIDQARWIPVSERLPEKGGLYLVTVVKEEWRTFVAQCFLGRKLTVEGEFMWFCDERCEITAWRPLPEPYEEEK